MNDSVVKMQFSQDQKLAARTDLTVEKLDLIKRTVAKGATNDELELFLYTAQKMGLDPLAKQIHAVKRWSSEDNRMIMAIQIGIDGFRLVADRTGRYAPGDPSIYETDSEGNIVSATAHVRKLVADHWFTVTETAYWTEYVGVKKDGTPNAMWKKLPRTMLAKCAEAKALRRAFPAELGGAYLHEEMVQAGPATQRPPLPKGPEPAAAPTEEPQAGDDGAEPALETVQGVVENVFIKPSPQGSKRKYTKVGVKIGGEVYGTFDLGLFPDNKPEDIVGKTAVVTWELNKDGYRDIVDLYLIEPAG